MKKHLSKVDLNFKSLNIQSFITDLKGQSKTILTAVSAISFGRPCSNGCSTIPTAVPCTEICTG